MRRRVFARLASVLFCSLASIIVLAPAAVSASSAAGLHVAGNHLVDGAGKTVTLHGVNISGTEFACAQGGGAGNAGWSIFGGQPEDDPATITAIKAWHANVVRIPLNEDCWLGINGISNHYGGAAYRAAISHLVMDLTTSGLYVIVDLHWSAPGTAVALSQQPMADADHSISFWTSVANALAANPAVLFDLYNEPFLYGSYFQSTAQDAWSCWLHGCALNQYLTGGQPYTRKLAWRTAGMQQLVNAVRSTGASNVVIVNGVNWANDDSGWLGHRPSDPARNLVAGWHEYEGEQCATVACWSRGIAPIAQRVPVVVGETGDHTGRGCTLVNLPQFLPWADQRGISYLAWTFNPWLYSHDVLIKDWKGTPSSCEGEFYAGHLAAIAQGLPASEPPLLTAAKPSNSDGQVAYSAYLMIGIILVILGLVVYRRSRRR